MTKIGHWSDLFNTAHFSIILKYVINDSGMPMIKLFKITQYYFI